MAPCGGCGRLGCLARCAYDGWRERGDDGWNGVTWCGECGRVCDVIRPGKTQCPECA